MQYTRVASRRRIWRATVVLASALGLASVGLGVTTASAEEDLDRICDPPACFEELKYGPPGDPYSDDRELDAYPALTAGSPTVVVVFGGGWHGGSRNGTAKMSEALVADGFAVFNIDYRLTVGPPDTPGSLSGVEDGDNLDQTKEIAMAVDWIIANGTQFGADVSDISLMGGSAGAQLVALAGQRINRGDYGGAPGTIKSVVEFSGPMDFETMIWPEGRGGPINPRLQDGMPSYLGCPVDECTPLELARPSATENIHHTNPSFMLINGDNELTPVQQVVIFHNALLAAGESSLLNVVTGDPRGTRHGFALFQSQQRKVAQFLGAPAPPTGPSFSVGDTSVAEGNSGTRTMTFTVTLTGSSSSPSTVDFATVDGTASAGSDYVETNGTLTFPAGPSPRTQTVPVTINGDTTNETDEALLLKLGGAGNATISNDQGRGVILNDDGGGGGPGTPTVTTRSPDVSATGVAGAVNVKATFSEPVTGVSQTTFTLRNAAGTVIPAKVTYNANTRLATLNPSASLSADNRYTVTLTGGPAAIRDAEQNPLALTSWTFLTGPAPAATTKSPKAGATAVSRTGNVVVNITETVAGVDTGTYTLSGPTGQIAAVVSRNGTTNRWTLNPSATLAANTTYTVILTGGPAAIRDLAGNPLTTTTWTFRTGA